MTETFSYKAYQNANSDKDEIEKLKMDNFSSAVNLNKVIVNFFAPILAVELQSKLDNRPGNILAIGYSILIHKFFIFQE